MTAWDGSALDGFMIPSLLPGPYQLRNLVVQFLLDESIEPELLFRSAANERAAVLLQDTETMLRQIIATVIGRILADADRAKLEAMQKPREVIDSTVTGSNIPATISGAGSCNQFVRTLSAAAPLLDL